MSVKYQHPDYVKGAPKWKRCRDVYEGQDAIHAGGELYLPKLADEKQKDFKARIKRATFYNATYRTIAGLGGMLFRKPPEQALPAAVDDLVKDISLKGVPLNVFARNVAEECLTVGRVGVLVDHPPKPATDAPITVAKAESLGLRPTLQLYKAEDIINWKFRKVNNKWSLSLVVLTEEYAEPKDEFEDKCETRYRVLDLDANDLYRMRVFRINAKGEDEQVGVDAYPMLDGAPLRAIPFVFIGPAGTEACVEDPPLIDLVDVNLAHYMVTADYEHGCHFTGLPTPWVSGYRPATDAKGIVTEKLYIGSTAAWIMPDVGAQCGYLEFTGTGMDALKDNLTGKQEQMAAIGARMLADSKAGVEAFKTVAINNQGETSILADVSISISLALEAALTIFCQWAGDKSGEDIKYELNRDFLPVAIDAQTLTAYLALWQAGRLGDEDLFNLLKQHDLIEPEKDFEEYQTGIDNSSMPPPLTALPKPGQPALTPPKPASVGNAA